MIGPRLATGWLACVERRSRDAEGALDPIAVARVAGHDDLARRRPGDPPQAQREIAGARLTRGAGLAAQDAQSWA